MLHELLRFIGVTAHFSEPRQVAASAARLRFLSGVALLMAVVGCGAGTAYDAEPATAAKAAPEEAIAADQDDGSVMQSSAGLAAPGYLAQGPAPAPQVPSATDAASPEQQPAQPKTPEVATDKRAPLLIYTGTLTLAVFEAPKHIDVIEKRAVEAGGYLVRRTDSSITVRVPSEKFQGFLEGVSKIGDELHREVSVRDVTEEYSDLAIRLKNAEAMRERLTALLDKTKNVEEALAVERELERVAGEIERIKGRLELLTELVAFSTLTVNFEARPVDQVSSEVHLPFPWLRSLGLPELLSL